VITVYFVRDGSKIRVDVPEGTTLMEAAKDSHVPIHEIPADCGGSCACCTCHIHLTDQWVDKLGKIDYNSPELELIEYEKEFIEGKSRLACQIKLKPEHDGLIVNLINNGI
jgi:2Fe-2S ferredoxin